ncbi:Helicase [Hexamita inflata]|uniref:Helicase n=1 Tax=Hexamita inflata TaxID=28002 RepID=A0AA86P3D3_9EUKA|nr:Helicase [Hexamita inflata]
MQSKMFNFCYECQENFVLSSPTASGKTVIAALCFLKSKKCVYVAPTKALIQNHLQEFKRMRFQAGALTSENSCDLTSELILTTPEKLEQLLIQNTISPDCVVFDEVQTAFTERGWLYEVCFQLLKKNKKRIVCLTASYQSSLHQYLDCKLFQFDQILPNVKISVTNRFQPHVLSMNSYFAQFSTIMPSIFTMLDGQTIIFVPTRAVAEKIALIISNLKQKSSLSQTQYVHKDLIACTKKGVAFHHAGLSQTDRQKVEREFQDKQIDTICCTTTLAVGIDFEVDHVIIFGTKKYDNGALVNYSQQEMLQMCGRAGRRKPGKCTVISDGIDGDQQNVSFDHMLYLGVKNVAQTSSLNSKIHDYLIHSCTMCESMDQIYEFYSNSFHSFNFKFSFDVIQQFMFELNHFIKFKENKNVKPKWLNEYVRLHSTVQSLYNAQILQKIFKTEMYSSNDVKSLIIGLSQVETREQHADDIDLQNEISETFNSNVDSQSTPKSLIQLKMLTKHVTFCTHKHPTKLTHIFNFYSHIWKNSMISSQQ